MFNIVNNNLKNENYSFNKNIFMASNENTRDLVFNVTMQLAKCENEDIAKEFCNNHGHPFFVFCKDSHISQQYGIKIKTHSGSLDYHKEIFNVWKKLSSDATRVGFKAHEAKKCWFTVAFDKGNIIDATLLRKIDLFMINNYEYFKKLSRRERNNFSLSNNKMHNELGVNQRDNDAIKYNRDDISFNFFRSTLKPETILSTIELCHSVVHFLKDNQIVFDDLYDNNNTVFSSYKRFINNYEYLSDYVRRFN